MSNLLYAWRNVLLPKRGWMTNVKLDSASVPALRFLSWPPAPVSLLLPRLLFIIQQLSLKANILFTVTGGIHLPCGIFSRYDYFCSFGAKAPTFQNIYTKAGSLLLMHYSEMHKVAEVDTWVVTAPILLLLIPRSTLVHWFSHNALWSFH